MIAQPAPPPAPTPVLVQGMLGTDLAAWKAEPRHAAAVCAPAARDARRTECSLPSQPIGGRYRARALTYGFVDGRLATVRFRSSIDAFPYVTALLKGAYGAPTKISRGKLKLGEGSLDHVAMTWRTRNGLAVLNDPVDGGALEVVLTSRALGGEGRAARTPEAG